MYDRGLTFKVRWKLIKLYYCDPDRGDFETIIQDVYFGNIHLCPKGTFVINGVKVVVSQLLIPGCFSQSFIKKKNEISARVIPFKGSWINFSR